VCMANAETPADRQRACWSLRRACIYAR